jgi:hypothetical protein
MWKEEGKGVSFFLNSFFIVEWLGGSGFFLKNMLKRDGRGRGGFCFFKSSLGR